ncbi:helix-turn-helix domain-containing protein [Roseobacter sp. OBYS 0001]|uniref:helix-turn-helix domain-containing protein n=1 Tax=Roseobacter sp. OBYS 0001 TaxID=882651 RepID=UPI001BC5E891|nr:helix-turn-helix domain-containing protein [Roseobacter sp. OBYS 0001]GIT86108.1 transcriptional regulator [Roseobacter sp. OBYS 0001]
MKFGQTLTEARRRFRASQTQLSALSGISQRQISFLESGRAAPRRQTVDKLAEALALNYEDAAPLYAAAGFLHWNARVEWSDVAFDEIRSPVAAVLQKQEPYPAYAVNRAGDILTSNQAFCSLVTQALGKGGVQDRLRGNIYDLTLSPDGIGRFLLNPEQVVPHVLRRLNMAALISADARHVLDRNQQTPLARKYAPRSREPMRGMPVFPERYRIDAAEIGLIAITASFGSPEDAVAQEIQIEFFLPSDKATFDWLSA